MPRANSRNLAHLAHRAAAHVVTAALALLTLLAPAALASGPRWVTGPPYFNTSGVPVVWYTNNPLYFTDPSDLSPTVNHAAADALVAAAASVWNLPTAAITVAQGGTLAEHISSANSYFTATGPVFPTDVQPANYAAVQIAVLYDSDGSITDMLLGSGASAPAECRQNAVTEDVDSIVPAGLIQHAILVLNGRCTGPAPEQQLQLRYQLERAFGRILGLGWSQTNDNVFTRSPAPTTVQAQNWPILHPIDIICGLYTYQCLPSPFTLRDDDISSISGLYPMFGYDPLPPPPAPGKTWSYIQAGLVWGTLSFPTGEGMQGVNVVLRRWRGGTAGPQPWDDVSSVTGSLFQRTAGNPVTGTSTSIAASVGATDASYQGRFQFLWIPTADPEGSTNGPMLGMFTTEPINPLYVGAYSVGPYTQQAVAPSGAADFQSTPYPIWPYVQAWRAFEFDLTRDNPAATCDTSADGTEFAPASFAATGWSSGLLCARGHSAWFSFSTRAGRTATVEVTALDENGYATTVKAAPLVGVWAAADPAGTLPTLAATPSAFNTVALGTTAARISTASAQSLRFVIADARGDGRPDFSYRARLLYADSVSPAATSLSGGLITISGLGFRPGNSVTINGVPAVVTGWTANTITAVAPPQSAFPTLPSAPVTVIVSDLSTGGSSTMSAALTYSSAVAPGLMALVSAPSGTLPAGQSTPTPFAVRITLGDGITPVAGLPVTFTWTGPAQLSGCASSPCILLTDSTGLASAVVTPTTFGSITLQASAVGASQTASFTAVSRSVSALQSTEYIAAGSSVLWTPQLAVIQNSAPAANIQVDWIGSTALTNSPGFSIAPASTATNANGIALASATLGPLASGAQAPTQATAQACAWPSAPPTLCATFTAIAVAPSEFRIAIVSGAGQTVASPAAFALPTFAPVILRITDTYGHPVAGAPVNLYQTVDAAQMHCPAHGPCPIPPPLASSTGSATSDVSGLVAVTPMQLPATAEITNIAAAAGTQGFAALALTQQP